MDSGAKQKLREEYEKKKLATKRQRLLIKKDLLDHPEKIVLYKEKCRRDIVYFTDMFTWTYDPRRRPSKMPFILYPFQEEYIKNVERDIDEGRDALTEKSRDMGVTWLVLVVFLHGFLFKGYDFRVGSRKEELVDKRGDADSLFEKLRFLLLALPVGFLPTGWTPIKHDRHMLLENPELKCSIAGEATNPNFGVGGRKKAILFDEFAKWSCAEDAWKKSADTTPCRLPISTPEGMGQKFSDVRFDKKVPIKVYTLHWGLHPYKDQKWYDDEKKRRTDQEVAQELDISYDRSAKSRVYEIWDHIERGQFKYNPAFPLFTSWDFGNDGTAIIWWQRVLGTRFWRIIDSYINYNKVIDFFVPFITGKFAHPYPYTEEELRMINERRSWLPSINFGDPSCKQHQMQYKYSIQEVLENNQIYIYTNDEAVKFESRKTATELLIRDIQLNINPRTEYLDSSIKNSRYPERSEMTTATSEILRPVHNWSSHYRTALEYLAVNRPEDPKENRDPMEEAFNRKIKKSNDFDLSNGAYS